MGELSLPPIQIDVGSLVQRSVATLYSHLVTRPTGRAVRLAIESLLAEAGDTALSLIDLSEVSVLDFYFVQIKPFETCQRLQLCKTSTRNVRVTDFKGV